MTAVDWNEVIRTGLTGVALLLSMSSAIYAGMLRRQSATKAAIETVEQKFERQMTEAKIAMVSNHTANQAQIKALEIHLGQMTEALKHAPTHGDMAAINTTIMGFSNSISRLEGAQEAATRMVERMNDYMIQRGT